MALRGRRINNFVELWCLVALRDLEIWVSSTSFQKSNIDWPQQPLTKKVSDISKKMHFWWSIPQKGTGFDHLSARDDPTIRISIFLWNEAVKVIEATDVVEAVEVIEATKVPRPEKSLLMTAESSRLLNSALFWCFKNKYSSVSIMKYQVEFWHLSSWRLLRPANGTFLKTGCWNSNFHTSWSH